MYVIYTVMLVPQKRTPVSRWPLVTSGDEREPAVQHHYSNKEIYRKEIDWLRWFFNEVMHHLD